MKSTLLFLLIIGSCSAHYAEDCPSICEEFNPMDYWEKEGYAPNVLMLRKLCPTTLVFLECRMREMEDCFGQSLEDMATSTNLSIASFSKTILATDNLIQLLCDEDSSFYRDYSRHIECYKAHGHIVKRFCRRDVSRVENLYLGTLKLASEKDINCKVKLFSTPYELACQMDLVGRACGPTSKRLFKKASLMFKDTHLIDCTRINRKWKEEFLNFLVQHKKKELEAVYDVFFEMF